MVPSITQGHPATDLADTTKVAEFRNGARTEASLILPADTVNSEVLLTTEEATVARAPAVSVLATLADMEGNTARNTAKVVTAAVSVVTGRRNMARNTDTADTMVITTALSAARAAMVLVVTLVARAITVDLAERATMVTLIVTLIAKATTPATVPVDSTIVMSVVNSSLRTLIKCFMKLAGCMVRGSQVVWFSTHDVGLVSLLNLMCICINMRIIIL